MIGAFMENLFDALLRPRRSVRQMIDRGFQLNNVLLMVLLGFVLREIFVLITPGARPQEGVMPLAAYIFGIIEAFMIFGMMTVAVHFVGRLFGGAGTLQESAITMAWYLLVITVFTPIMLPAVLDLVETAKLAMETPDTAPVLSGGTVLALMVTSGMTLWLLAAYIAELHRFQSTWSVLFVVIGLSLPVPLLLSSLMPAA